MSNFGREDARTPCGAWVGFYLYSRSDIRHRMTLDLRFTDGNVRGSGIDGVGEFLIDGRIDSTKGDVHWTKTYLDPQRIADGQVVHYEGQLDGQGIWGVWRSSHDGDRGGFRIWPDADADAPAEEDCDELVLSIDTPYRRSAVGFTGHAPFGSPF